MTCVVTIGLVVNISYLLTDVSPGTRRSEVMDALLEWNRVLVPGGELLLAVPDIEALAAILTKQTLSRKEKLVVMHVIYGGQDDQYNVHWTGFYWEFLVDILSYAGFCAVHRVNKFGLFDDSSELNLFGYGDISLNVVARKCTDGDGQKQYTVY